MLGQTTNKQLQAVEQAVQEKIPANMQAAFQRIVAAGMKVMYSPQTRQMLQNQMNQPGEPTEIAGEGVAKLIAMLFKESKATMPMQAAVPAAQVLLCEGLDFMEKSGKLKVDNDTIAAATQAMVAYLLQIFGITQDKLGALMQAGGRSQKPAGIVEATQGGA